jgi:outer membrane beta-barrel protein
MVMKVLVNKASKMNKLKYPFMVLALLTAVASNAQSPEEEAIGPTNVRSAKQKNQLLSDFDALGGNRVLLEKAQALSPETTVLIVQNRQVSRRRRFELAPEYANIVGGDPYVKTQSLGMNLHFHITPHWSLGLKYVYALNELRPEGEALIYDRKLTRDGLVPDVMDYLKSETLAVLNWYPIYGKVNLFDLGVAHFDVYAVAGGGFVELAKGRSNTYTGGAGVGFWFVPHYTLRTELRFQTYDQQIYSGKRSLQTTVLNIQAGYLF